MTPDIRAESVRWLLDRLPPGTPPPEANGLTSGDPAVRLLGWGRGGRHLRLAFESPHVVRFRRFDGRASDGGVLNLAMDLQEILDLIRDTTGAPQ